MYYFIFCFFRQHYGWNHFLKFAKFTGFVFGNLRDCKKRETILITFSMSMSCWGGISFNLDINFSVGSFSISYKFQVIHILCLNILFPSTFLFIYPSVIFSFVFCFKAALRLGETWPFAVNTKLSLVRAMKLCKIHSRTLKASAQRDVLISWTF